MALKPLKRPKLTRYTPPSIAFKPWKPPKVYKAPAGRGSRGYDPSKAVHEPYTGPGVQDYINEGTIGWDQGLGDIGYTKPPTPGTPSPGGAGLIGGDWEVQQAEAMHAARMARSRGDFQAGLRQALIDLGIGDTSKLGSLGQYIDNDTIQAAINNKYSSTAKIAQQATAARAQNNAALAARGMLSSGQTTKSQQDVSNQAEAGRFSALREFLSGGAQGLSGLADMEYEGAQGIAAARSAAAARAADLYPGAFTDEPAGTAATTTTTTTTSSAKAARAAAARKAAAAKAAAVKRRLALARRPIRPGLPGRGPGRNQGGV